MRTNHHVVGSISTAPLCNSRNKRRNSGSSLIDLRINNAVTGVQEQDTYAQTNGEHPCVGRLAQAGFGIVGFRSLFQRSGAAQPMPCPFGDALAGWLAGRRSQGFADAFLSEATVQAGPHATKTLGGFASARTTRAWLPNQSVDDDPRCGFDLAGVRSPSITATMLAGGCTACKGALRDRNGAGWSGMKKPSNAGNKKTSRG